MNKPLCIEDYHIEDLFTITNNIVIECLNLDYTINYIMLKRTLVNLPYKFGIVNCDFYCVHTRLKTLNNCPIIINGDFACYNCQQLVSLEGALKIIKGYFNYGKCPNVKISENVPKYIKGMFNVNKV